MRALNIIQKITLTLIILGAGGLMFFAARTDSIILGEPVGFAFTRSVSLFRLAQITLTLFIILLAYFWSKEIVGRFWALFPAFFIAFSPNILAMGHFATIEITAIFTIFLATLAFLTFLRKRSLGAVVITGAAFGVAQFISFSALVLVPYFIIITLVYIIRSIAEDYKRGGYTATFWKRSYHRFRSLLLTFIIGYILLYGLYSTLGWSFRSRYLEGAKSVWRNWITRVPDIKPAVHLLSTEPKAALVIIILAAFYAVLTVTKVSLRTIRRNFGSLSGVIDIYFLEIALGIFVILYSFLERNFVVALPIFYIFVTALIKSRLGVYGLEFARDIRAKVVILYRERFKVIAKIIFLSVIIIWQLIAVAMMAPQFLKSDRGQDLIRLEKWIKKNRIEKIAVDYSGPINAAKVLSGVSENWSAERGNPGINGIYWLAVSKSHLLRLGSDSLKYAYSWLENNYRQRHLIGNTIYVFNLTE